MAFDDFENEGRFSGLLNGAESVSLKEGQIALRFSLCFVLAGADTCKTAGNHVATLDFLAALVARKRERRTKMDNFESC